MSERNATLVHAPVSIGELIDKITILQIKAERITEPHKRDNVVRELALLEDLHRGLRLDPGQDGAFLAELRAVNTALWDIEDDIRGHEARGDFGANFIALARAVYQTNDRRAQIKARINSAFGSQIVEEKAYRQS